MPGYPWSCALIAGAPSPMGAAFAELLVGEGLAVEVVEADLADESQLATVERRLASDEAPIDLLINILTPGPRGALTGLDPAATAHQLARDVRAPLRLTHAALQTMTAARHGAVLNISSTSGLLPTPGEALNGATHAFVISHSQALQVELRGTGVSVTALVAEPNVAGARAGLAAAAQGAAFRVPGFADRAFVSAVGPLPRWVKRRVFGATSGRKASA